MLLLPMLVIEQKEKQTHTLTDTTLSLTLGLNAEHDL